jgi:hypothetical protein
MAVVLSILLVCVDLGCAANWFLAGGWFTITNLWPARQPANFERRERTQ